MLQSHNMSAISGILAFALLFAGPLVSALQVTPGSPCASACLDDKEGNPIDVDASTTGLNDIVCNDIDFHSSLVGTKYRTCLECLQNSTKSEGPETDTSWYLYNVKYAVDVCLYSFPNATQGSSSPCSLAPNCGSLQTALETGNLRPNESVYDYCTADNGAFGGEAVNSCSQCLQATSEQKYMSNFITALAAGCQQKPVLGTTLSLRGSLFSTSTPLAIVEPSTNQTVTTSQTATTALTTGAIVGIVVGASLLFLGGLALFFVHWRRQRRHARENEDPKPPSNKTSGSYSNITTNRPGGRPSPRYTTDHKEGLPAYEVHDPRDYTHNADYYDRMDNYYEPSSNLSVLPAHPAYIPRTHARASRAASPSLDPQQFQQQRPQKSHPTSILSHSVAAPASDYASTQISPPPPNPHPRRVSPQPHSVHPSQRPSPPMAPSQAAAQPPPPPPPPPPPREPTLSLVMPSVSNLRGPKRYAPPKIEVQGATPINEQADINISLPISYPEERFREGRERHNNVAQRSPSPSDSIVEHTVDRPLLKQYKEMPIASGKSTLYGM